MVLTRGGPNRQAKRTQLSSAKARKVGLLPRIITDKGQHPEPHGTQVASSLSRVRISIGSVRGQCSAAAHREPIFANAISLWNQGAKCPARVITGATSHIDSYFEGSGQKWSRSAAIPGVGSAESQSRKPRSDCRGLGGSLLASLTSRLEQHQTRQTMKPIQENAPKGGGRPRWPASFPASFSVRIADSELPLRRALDWRA